MTEPKDGESFFRKVARFVANPTTDWAEINSRQDDPEGDMAKAELRAMVERKRRNDFVRKRELDMLRRIRREGLSPEQLAALGSSSSRLDEVERISEMNSKIDPRVKDKINEIEQQMVGESFAPTQLAGGHPPGFFETSTRPVHFASTLTTEPTPGGAPNAAQAPNSQHAPIARVSQFASPEEAERLEALPPPAAVTMGAGMSPLSDAKPSRLPELRDLPPLEMPPAGPPLSFGIAEAASHAAQELVHDPELDEAVIAFANADYETTERILSELIKPGGLRNLHGETWLVLFDHYRATGAQAKFEALAVDYAQQFGLSAPQWFSMPKLVAEAAKSVRAPMGSSGGVGWTAPEYLLAESVQQLQQRCQNLPMPWVLDWAPLRQLDAEAAEQLRQLFRVWAKQQLDMRWLSGDHFLQLLKEQAPVAVRDVDPALWMLRLEALRLVNRPDQFDETAIDYCVTYEVSPPSWERASCRVRVSGASLSTSGPASTTASASELSTSFLESTITEQTQMVPSVQLELSGQLVGDISETLRLMTAELGAATIVNVACPKLIRLDFMAAGDLLNWVLARRSENRSVVFGDAHRLVALFFGAMGINEHAKIKVRQV
ncbi:hypothetical protein [Roseateles violae]|uniref:STAS domain-containing protein n=1 Tax=Roseateles violae TaxID=3058042 RepID=A0ABT8DYI4_9BURK|nr:hypothetical protein [Pelomonas sp. PFR6]MDN3922635.1 hypothetical protein [Pelomonas sp. PFR6]